MMHNRRWTIYIHTKIYPLNEIQSCLHLHLHLKMCFSQGLVHSFTLTSWPWSVRQHWPSKVLHKYQWQSEFKPLKTHLLYACNHRIHLKKDKTSYKQPYSGSVTKSIWSSYNIEQIMSSQVMNSKKIQILSEVKQQSKF